MNQVINVASLLTDLKLSQNSYSMIQEFNNLSSNNFSPCCFYQNISVPPININFPVLNSYYLPYWKGAVFATNFETADLLINIKGPCKKYFYIFDLEWLRYGLDFKDTTSILTNTELTLVARNYDHAMMIKNYCNIAPRFLLNDWNANQLLEIVQWTN